VAGAFMQAVAGVPTQTTFNPSLESYFVLMAVGFAVAGLGHVYGSKILIAAGLLIVYAAILFLPLLAFLS
jgi:hypothetical protein